MTTLSRDVPTLEGRVLNSTLILVGTVEEGPVSMPDYGTDPPQVHSMFRIAVEETLRGRAPSSSVAVRVLGGQVEQLRTEFTTFLKEGDRVLAFLAPYYAAERQEDTFVPYFRGCYRVSKDAVVEMEGRLLREAHAEAGRDTMTIDGARTFVQAALQRREQSVAAQPEREPEEQEMPTADLPAMLHVEPGGARWTTLDGAADRTPRSGG